MTKTYNNTEAAKLLKLTERDICELRERTGVTQGGNLSENNITTMKSYIEKVGYKPKKRGRPKKTQVADKPKSTNHCRQCKKEKPTNQFCIDADNFCIECNMEKIKIDEKKSKEIETTQKETQSEPMFVSLERVKELVIEAHEMGYAKGRKDFKIADIGLDELLGAS